MQRLRRKCWNGEAWMTMRRDKEFGSKLTFGKVAKLHFDQLNLS